MVEISLFLFQVVNTHTLSSLLFMPYSALLCDGFMCAWAWRFGNGTNVRFVTLLRQVRNRAVAIKLAYNKDTYRP